MPTVKIEIKASGTHYLSPAEMAIVKDTYAGDLAAYFKATHFHGMIASPWSRADMIEAELVKVEL